ncbi:MAG: multicopper oxidase family protein [Acidimicrobiia bacterium]
MEARHSTRRDLPKLALLAAAALVAQTTASAVALAWTRSRSTEQPVTSHHAPAAQPQSPAPTDAQDLAANPGHPVQTGPRGDGTLVAPHEQAADGAKEFRLRAAPVTWEVEPGKVRNAYAFNGTVPGPTIRVNEGDRVRIIVENQLPEGTGVHWHGMVLPHDQDGVPGITQKAIEPGQSYTYEWTAVSTGTHWYHSHFTGSQVGKGLYGSLEVVPLNGDRLVDRDYRLFVGDTDLGFVFNGKSYPATAPFPALVGERVRIRITNAGEQSHPIHLHGQPFDLVAQDGFDLATPVTMDTLLVSTAQTFDIVTTALAPGRWLLHCHIFSHMHKSDEHDMTGLVTLFDVVPSDLPLPAVPGPAGPRPALPVTPPALPPPPSSSSSKL